MNLSGQDPPRPRDRSSRAARVRSRSVAHVAPGQDVPPVGSVRESEAEDGSAAHVGQHGRIGIFTCNFGDYPTGPAAQDLGGASALAGLSSCILCVQEATPQLHARMVAQLNASRPSDPH